MWTKTIQVVALWEPLQRFSGVFQQFHSSLLHLLNHGLLITHQIVYQPDESLLEERKEKKRQVIARKHELAAVALQVIKQKKDDGYLLVYTDGSAEYVATQGWIGGWECCSADGWEQASHLPTHTRQTINRAQLQAVIEVVQCYHDSNLKVAVYTDSAYVYGGVKGGGTQMACVGLGHDPRPSHYR